MNTSDIAVQAVYHSDPARVRNGRKADIIGE